MGLEVASLVKLQVLSCWFLTGLICVIQFLHYPAFMDVDPSRFQSFHARHSQVITWIVGPLMLVELVTAFLLVAGSWGKVAGVSGLESTTWLVNLGLVAVIWGCTVFVSVPIHNQLAQGYSEVLILQLIRTNWPRTILWVGRALVLAFVAQ